MSKLNMRNIGMYYPADQRAVEYMLNTPANDEDDDGRSGWKWFRLVDGTLILGFFPQGLGYESVENYYTDDYTLAEKNHTLADILADDEDIIRDPEPWVLFVDGKDTGLRFAEKHPSPEPPVEYRFIPRASIPKED